ncbi:hypothetical protein [Pontibacillus sp. ALD_SL1]|uniref:DUF6904 family protein n=1 Tax=Pontibacillus sp. ALD_SL1 TaxID=2777185 RepID=UPI0035304E9B
MRVTNTPKLAGLKISGDPQDLEEIYDALHSILPNEGEDPSFEGSRTRVLGFCYEIRHAMQGNRDIEFVHNHMTQEKMKFHEIISNNQNVHYSFAMYYPEMLYITAVLNVFIEGFSRSRTGFPSNKHTILVQYLHACVKDCLQEVLSPQKFRNAAQALTGPHYRFSNFRTQYVDLLNLRYLEWDAEKRQQNLSIMAKRLTERGKEYQQLEEEVYEAAAQHQCHPDEIRLKEDYPESIDW